MVTRNWRDYLSDSDRRTPQPFRINRNVFKSSETLFSDEVHWLTERNWNLQWSLVVLLVNLSSMTWPWLSLNGLLKGTAFQILVFLSTPWRGLKEVPFNFWQVKRVRFQFFIQKQQNDLMKGWRIALANWVTHVAHVAFDLQNVPNSVHRSNNGHPSVEEL